jgi:hypothetical protein
VGEGIRANRTTENGSRFTCFKLVFMHQSMDDEPSDSVGPNVVLDVFLHVQPTTYHVQRVLNVSTVDGRSLPSASVGRSVNVGRNEVLDVFLHAQRIFKIVECYN